MYMTMSPKGWCLKRAAMSPLMVANATWPRYVQYNVFETNPFICTVLCVCL